jgi:hypothetical protein
MALSPLAFAPESDDPPDYSGGFGVSTFAFTAVGCTMGGGSMATTRTDKEIATDQIRKKRIDLCYMKQGFCLLFLLEGVVFSFQNIVWSCGELHQ